MQKKQDRFLGVMFGGAVGDAMGSATEFLTPDKFGYVTELQGRPKFRTKPGERTDDTAMTLCLGQSLIDCNGFNLEDQLDKYLDRYANGYMSSIGRAFGIGNQTSRILYDYKLYKEGKIDYKPREIDLSGKNKDGNGSIMRIGPVALFYSNDIENALYYAGESVKATHNTDVCVSSAKCLIGLILGALGGESKENLLQNNYSPIKDYRDVNNLNHNLRDVMSGSYKNKNSDQLGLKYGYVVDSLEVALRGFYHSTEFEDGLLRIINLGGDADTNGCIYGFLAGAYYGYDAIPERRKENIAKKELIRKIALQLFESSN